MTNYGRHSYQLCKKNDWALNCRPRCVHRDQCFF